MVQEVLSGKILCLVLLFLLLHQCFHCLLFHPLNITYLKAFSWSKIRTPCTGLLKLPEISEINKEKDPLKIFLASLPSTVIWNKKECLLYWSCKDFRGRRRFSQGFSQKDFTGWERQRLSGDRGKCLCCCFLVYPEKKHLICVVAGGKEKVGGSIKACCFSPTSRKKQSKIDMKWTEI